MVDVTIQKINEVHVRVLAEPHIKMEMSEYFTFFANNYKWHPKFKNKQWDGKIRLLNQMTGIIYSGLLNSIIKFCEDREYSCIVDDDLIAITDYPEDFGHQLAKQFDAAFKPHDFQNEAVTASLSQKRSLMVCPTGSGKSFIIYLIARHHVENMKHKVLIIGSTVDLVVQMQSDFTDYNKNQPLDIHQVYAGQEKESCSSYVMSTWQSLQHLKEKYFNQYDVVLVDEAHGAEAKQLTSILEKCKNVAYRYGTTGTLKDAKTNKLTLTGLIGPIHNVRTTKQLQDQGILSQLKINALVLNYDQQAIKNFYENATIQKESSSGKKIRKLDYKKEIDWIITNDRRNMYICNLANKMKGNTLILFQYVENHGHVLKQMFDDMGIKVHFIHGKVKKDQRTEIRNEVKQSDNNIILASYGTFSTGINIPNLNNLIFASPSKGKIRNLQSIGRILRKSNDKKHAVLIDIVDNLKKGRKENYALKHFADRAEIYSNEKFPFKIFNINIKG